MSAKFFPTFEPPSKAAIWRYISMDRLEAVLETRTLYFASARQFQDKDNFEGAITEQGRARRATTIPGFSEAEQSLCEPTASGAFEQLRRLTKINCWHQNDGESVAMWQLYVPQGKGVVIRSEVSRLLNSFNPFRLKAECEPETLWIGQVKYLDYKSDSMNDESMLGVFFHKRKSFEHEREIRLAISLRLAEEFGCDVPDEGVHVEFDPNCLIQEIRTAPGTESKAKKKLEEMLKASKVGCEVRHSELEDAPFY